VWGVPMSVSGWGTSRRVRPARVPALCTELVQRTRRARSEIASDGALLVSAKITHFHHRRRRPDPSRSFRAQACPDTVFQVLLWHNAAGCAGRSNVLRTTREPRAVPACCTYGPILPCHSLHRALRIIFASDSNLVCEAMCVPFCLHSLAALNGGRSHESSARICSEME